jgi:hypothetical protein
MRARFSDLLDFLGWAGLLLVTWSVSCSLFWTVGLLPRLAIGLAGAAAATPVHGPRAVRTVRCLFFIARGRVDP